MGYKIDEIEGIGPANSEKLSAAMIATTDQLLEKCGSAAGRKECEAATGISAKQLLKWANMADLMRIKGVGRQYSELLEASGVDTVKELKMRKPENLAPKMKEINDEKKLAKATPTAEMVQGWCEEAKVLAPAITH